ncbi:myoD family inhibitor domain-containing protein 2 isoform X2 [Syngnathoides biaculeatus]|uniref:myoD family inhibitor domain-containing protein 2 isoform X2 n=1 Tax=Syngnathoides biaculeatus TaxID=300417 RepID=UPI002ADDC2CE|nr:myoD family inhibitor domain-containing protein 2 isoform X2 [Syngnathoides biaculeatus]XP_061689324.1 myoD family inhibitor domain-containing protein 2 isoform X2 [Syngnathoides biaculeatus]
MPKDFEKLDCRCEDSPCKTDLKSPNVPVLYSCIAGETEAQEQNMQNSNHEEVQARLMTDLSCVEKQQPQLLSVLLSSGTKESITSAKKSQELNTNTFIIPPGEDDLCTPILLGCLFCHPLDCLLATVRGCSKCLCSSLFCCEPATTQSLLNITQHCNVCRCQELCDSQCDCSICGLCLQATECLDLAMEISQMLYH